MDRNLMKANSWRLNYDHQSRQQVLIKTVSPAKLVEQSEGPYRVEAVHAED